MFSENPNDLIAGFKKKTETRQVFGRLCPVPTAAHARGQPETVCTVMLEFSSLFQGKR